ncbi:MAG: YggT family protein [Candidatus Limnocylindria bacterium]
MTVTTERPDAPTTVTTTTRTPEVIHVQRDAPGHTSIWTATRVIALTLTVVETVLLARFALLLFGANANQALVAFVYAITDPLVRPFQGIFAQPAGPPVFEVAAVLAVLFFLLLGALVVAVVRAVTGRRTGPRPTGQ